MTRLRLPAIARHGRTSSTAAMTDAIQSTPAMSFKDRSGGHGADDAEQGADDARRVVTGYQEARQHTDDGADDDESDD